MNSSNDPGNETADTSPIDLCLSIIQLSDDGDRLDPAHLALVQAAVNGSATPAGIELLRNILRELEADTYQKPWLQGIEPLTVTNDGYILYKGHEVEHYDHPYRPSNKASLEELSIRCQRIEALGLTPSTSLAVYRWGWLKDLVSAPPQLHNALSLYELYRHTQTGDIIGHLNHRVPTVSGMILMYREDGTWRLQLPSGTEDDWLSDYHGVQQHGYEPVRFVEPSHTGLSGQPLDSLLTLFESIELPVDIHQRALELINSLPKK